MAESFGRMRAVVEMDVLHQQIGGEQEIFPRTPRAEYSAIVSDTLHQAGFHGQARPAADGIQDDGLAARQRHTALSRIWFLGIILQQITLDRTFAICDNSKC